MVFSSPKTADADPRAAWRAARLETQEPRGHMTQRKGEDCEREANRVRHARRGDPGRYERVHVDRRGHG